jgi:trypsin
MAKSAMLGVAANIVVGAMLAAAPGAYASGQATGTPSVPSLPGGGHLIKAAALPHRNLPPNARLATHPLPKVGRRGPLFQPVPTSGSSSRIVNGTLANSADYPSVVGIESLFLVQDDQGNEQPYIGYCSGTVLSPTKILTAAHCTADLRFGYTVVIAGRSQLDTDTGGTVVAVSATMIPSGFNLAQMEEGTQVPHNDVAVLTLKTALPGAYPPVTLPAQGAPAPQAGTGTIIGYGITQSGVFDPGTLRTADVPVQDNATCSAAYPGDFASGMICAGQPPTGADTCGGDSGGPLMLSGQEVGITDWGQVPCGSSYGVYTQASAYVDTITADVNRTAPVNLDWSGDGHSDLIGRDSAGNLYLYSGTGYAEGFPAIDGKDFFNAGWGGYSKLFRVTNWNGDGGESIMAETPDGYLYRYDEAPDGSIAPRVLIGNGWNAFADIMVTNNWTGDGHPNLMGRTKAGDLVLYTSDGHGGWLNPMGTLIGNGWNGFDTVTTPGDWYGNGHQSLIGRTPHGELVIYNSDGAGGWTNPTGTLIGTGWNGFRLFMSPGDFNGDDMVDIIGVTPGGSMYLYTTDGHGNWQTGIGVPIGAGWQYYNQIF